MADALADILDWVAIYCPAPLRPELIGALRTAQQTAKGDAAELWKALAEALVVAGQLDIAREALRKWKILAPPDHPLHAVLDALPPEAGVARDPAPAPAPPPRPSVLQPPSPPPRPEAPPPGFSAAELAAPPPPPRPQPHMLAEPRNTPFNIPSEPAMAPEPPLEDMDTPPQSLMALLAEEWKGDSKETERVLPAAGVPPLKPQGRRVPFPIPKREEPTSRIVRVIDNTYNFKRIDPVIEQVMDKKVVHCWECQLDPEDASARGVLNEFQDGTYGPWAVSGLSSDFAGAAAAEVVVRSMQRHFVFTNKKHDATRKTLINIILPLATIVGVLLGYMVGVSH